MIRKRFKFYILIFMFVPNDRNEPAWNEQDENNIEGNTDNNRIRGQQLFRIFVTFSLLLMLMDGRNKSVPERGEGSSTISGSHYYKNNNYEIVLPNSALSDLKLVLNHKGSPFLDQNVNLTGLYQGNWYDVVDPSVYNTSIKLEKFTLQLKTVPFHEVNGLSFIYGTARLFQQNKMTFFPLQGIHILFENKVLLLSTPYQNQKIFIQILEKVNQTTIKLNSTRNLLSSNNGMTTDPEKNFDIDRQFHSFLSVLQHYASYFLSVTYKLLGTHDSSPNLTEILIFNSAFPTVKTKWQCLNNLVWRLGSLLCMSHQTTVPTVTIPKVSKMRNLKRKLTDVGSNKRSLSEQYLMILYKTPMFWSEEHGAEIMIRIVLEVLDAPPSSMPTTLKNTTNDLKSGHRALNEQNRLLNDKDLKLAVWIVKDSYSLSDLALTWQFKSMLLPPITNDGSSSPVSKLCQFVFDLSASSSATFTPLNERDIIVSKNSSIQSHLPKTYPSSGPLNQSYVLKSINTSAVDFGRLKYGKNASEVVHSSHNSSDGKIARKTSSIAIDQRSISPSRKTFLLFNYLQGTAIGQDCKKELHMQAVSYQLPVEEMITKIEIYSLVSIVIGLIQIFLVIYQLRFSQNQAVVSRISIIAIFSQSLLDAIICMVHLALAAAIPNLFISFFWVSLLKLLLFSVFQMRIIINIYQARYSQEIASEGWQGMRRRIIGLHLQFYLVLLAFLIFSIFFPTKIAYSVLALYSFWLPQIIYSIGSGLKPSFHPIYLVGISISRMFLPLYVFGCPENFIIMISRYFHPDLQIEPLVFSPSICYIIICWVSFQVFTISLQSIYGARFFWPKQWRPARYNYRRQLPDHYSQYAANSSSDSNNNIAMPEPIDVSAQEPSGNVAVAYNGGSLNSFFPFFNRIGRRLVSTVDQIFRSRNNETSRKTEISNDGDIEVHNRLLGEDDTTHDLEEGSEVPPIECVICFNSIYIHQKNYMITPCDHLFHDHCLSQWINYKMECPVCRAALPSTEEQD